MTGQIYEIKMIYYNILKKKVVSDQWSVVRLMVGSGELRETKYFHKTANYANLTKACEFGDELLELTCGFNSSNSLAIKRGKQISFNSSNSPFQNEISTPTLRWWKG